MAEMSLVERAREVASKTKYRHSEADFLLTKMADEIERLTTALSTARGETAKDAEVLCEVAAAAARWHLIKRATAICTARSTAYRYSARFQCGGHTADRKLALADELDSVAATIYALAPQPHSEQPSGDLSRIEHLEQALRRINRMADLGEPGICQVAQQALGGADDEQASPAK